MAAMKIAIGAFARAGIESELGSSLPDAVQAALCHYCGKLQSGRPPVAPPAFLADDGGHEEDIVLDRSVDPEIESALAHEAQARGLPLDRLAGHTVLVYLAELELHRRR
jgi:hypothetical protein